LPVVGYPLNFQRRSERTNWPVFLQVVPKGVQSLQRVRKRVHPVLGIFAHEGFPGFPARVVDCFLDIHAEPDKQFSGEEFSELLLLDIWGVRLLGEEGTNLQKIGRIF